MIHLKEQYAQLEHNYEVLRQKEAQKANIVAALRLFFIISMFVSGYYFFNAQNWVALGLSVLGFGGAFLVLVFVHAHIKEGETVYEVLIKINKNEQAYLDGKLSNFDNGEAFINPEHPYTYDLDMFGNQSIFQHLNRTTTSFGEAYLAKNMQFPQPYDIVLRQDAIKELVEKRDWRQMFQAQGLMFSSENEHIEKFENWLLKPSVLSHPRFFRIISYILPACTLMALVLNFSTNLPYTYEIFKTLGIFNLLLVASQQKHIKQEHELLNNMSQVFQKYAKLLKSIENQEFTTPKLNQLKQSIVVEDALASQALKRLALILNQFDTIYNPVAAILSNSLFQYHIHALFGLDKWKQTFGRYVSQWFQVIAEFEALSSIANFAENHPDFIFPTVNTEGVLMMKKIGHPLIASQKRIGNDVAFDETKFIILTGSNMSGKSTFLRTLGVNLVLAKMGAPVCAEQFSFYPYNVFVSMRVSDSLQNDESFFFAELKRLQRIMSELKENEKTFIILDEILRGTNSNDKRAGTIGLIKNLINNQAVGIIATHDLVIGDMETQYPNYLKNKCFEVQIINDELFFDYKLKDGVCQKMSAAFLMKKMGIIAP